MKIYCNRNDDIISFIDRFVGKDMWIKCRIIRSGNWWIRILARDGFNLTVNIVYPFIETSKNHFYEEYVESRTRNVSISELFFPKPLEILTTDELFSRE